MRRRLALLLLLAVSLVPTVAVATTGGPSTMAVLGYAPVDRKVFVLESFHDESGRLPQLYYIRLDGPRRGALVPVRSYDPVETDWLAADAAYHARLESLERRLVELDPIDVAEFSHTLERKRRVRTRDHHGTVWHGWRARSVVRHRGTGESGAGTLVFYRGHAGSPRLVHAARVPGLRWAIVVVRYLGHANETGYERDLAVLVPMVG